MFMHMQGWFNKENNNSPSLDGQVVVYEPNVSCDFLLLSFFGLTCLFLSLIKEFHLTVLLHMRQIFGLVGALKLQILDFVMTSFKLTLEAELIIMGSN